MVLRRLSPVTPASASPLLRTQMEHHFFCVPPPRGHTSDLSIDLSYIFNALTCKLVFVCAVCCVRRLLPHSGDRVLRESYDIETVQRPAQVDVMMTTLPTALIRWKPRIITLPYASLVTSRSSYKNPPPK